MPKITQQCTAELGFLLHHAALFDVVYTGRRGLGEEIGGKREGRR